MKFLCNGGKWTIKIVDETVMNSLMKSEFTLGATFYKEQVIYLLEDQANIVKTLKHELVHVWLYEYGHPQNETTRYDFEDICEIVASSNDFINEIVKKFIKERSKDETD